MTSHYDVARAFARGEKSTGSRMYTDGETIWSYGNHYPIATRLKNGVYLFNKDNYSKSTGRHASYVTRAIDGDIIECTTKEIKNAIDTGVPIIYREIEPVEVNKELDHLSKACVLEGYKKAPIAFIKQIISGEVKKAEKFEYTERKVGKLKGRVVYPRGRETFSVGEHDNGFTLRFMKKELKLGFGEMQKLIYSYYKKISMLIHPADFDIMYTLLKHEPKYLDVLSKIVKGELTDEDKTKLEEEMKMRDVL